MDENVSKPCLRLHVMITVTNLPHGSKTCRKSEWGRNFTLGDTSCINIAHANVAEFHKFIEDIVQSMQFKVDEVKQFERLSSDKIPLTLTIEESYFTPDINQKLVAKPPAYDYRGVFFYLTDCYPYTVKFSSVMYRDFYTKLVSRFLAK